jgi:cupin fold WbuC family metalloprotein
MNRIFSHTKPTLLLHIINKEVTHDRKDISPNEEFLQASCFKMNNGKTFRPHKHIFKKVEERTVITQETWIIIKGRVKVYLYDIDDKIIHTDILTAGECTITFRGGHNYECLEDDTLVYEVKTGPYEGQERDKTFIQ